jgi:hypothetical protein
MTASPSYNSVSLRQALDYCLNVLEIKQHSEFMSRTTASIPISMIKTHGNWITAMKLIADWSGALGFKNDNGDQVFSQTQLYDFLALGTKVIEERRVSENKIVLKMLRDIMENYENFSHSLKSNYPGIIVDIISILQKGVDTNGTRINPITIEKYYQSRKQQQTMMVEEEHKEVVKKPATTRITTTAAIRKQKILLLSKNDLVESLSQITNRDRKELEESLAGLQYSDLKKISELCRNYGRLQYYSKLITKEGYSQEEFKNEIQRELGRNPRSQQLVRAAASIRRTQTYIENILDNKFIPDDSHGINHVKHNLEYGYQLMNLIERPRRRPRTRN